MTKRRSYRLDQSPFYRLQTRKKLAKLLFVSEKVLIQICSNADNYIRYTNAKGRAIEWPKPKLRRIHKRVADLLSRIETPEFLHSAKKGKSYITNAEGHTATEQSVKVDIEKFFQSARAAAVFHFFKDKMLCAPDVAGILTRLLTVDGHLPTGGNASPILSYFAYADMFAEIESLSSARRVLMTCLMDDMTFTGPGANADLLNEVRRVVAKNRLHAHKISTFKALQNKVITGVAVTRFGPRVPYARQDAIREDLIEFRRPHDDDTRLAIARRAMGRAYEAAQIDENWLPRARWLSGQRRHLEKRVRDAYAGPNVTNHEGSPLDVGT